MVLGMESEVGGGTISIFHYFEGVEFWNSGRFSIIFWRRGFFLRWGRDMTYLPYIELKGDINVTTLFSKLQSYISLLLAMNFPWGIIWRGCLLSWTRCKTNFDLQHYSRLSESVGSCQACKVINEHIKQLTNAQRAHYMLDMLSRLTGRVLNRHCSAIGWQAPAGIIGVGNYDAIYKNVFIVQKYCLKR